MSTGEPGESKASTSKDGQEARKKKTGSLVVEEAKYPLMSIARQRLKVNVPTSKAISMTAQPQNKQISLTRQWRRSRNMSGIHTLRVAMHDWQLKTLWLSSLQSQMTCLKELLQRNGISGISALMNKLSALCTWLKTSSPSFPWYEGNIPISCARRLRLLATSHAWHLNAMVLNCSRQSRISPTTSKAKSIFHMQSTK